MLLLLPHWNKLLLLLLTQQSWIRWSFFILLHFFFVSFKHRRWSNNYSMCWLTLWSVSYKIDEHRYCCCCWLLRLFRSDSIKKSSFHWLLLPASYSFATRHISWYVNVLLKKEYRTYSKQISWKNLVNNGQKKWAPHVNSKFGAHLRINILYNNYFELLNYAKGSYPKAE